MKLLLSGAILLLLMSCGLIFAADYSIGKVVEVGPGSPAIVGTLKWSPDGSTLAYFRDGALYVSDTLGASHLVASSDMDALRYEWQSNDDVVVHYKQHPSELTDINQLTKINIKNGRTEQLEAFTRSLDPKIISSTTAFSGPWRTVEGATVYRSNVMQAKGSKLPEVVKPISAATADKAATTALESNHLLSWGDDGLYLVRADLKESTLVAPKPANYCPLPAVLSPDRSCYLFRDLLYWFADKRSIMLGTLISKKDYPDGKTFCDFLFYSFNPQGTEILFNMIFSNGSDNEEEIFRMGTYNYVTNQLTILDPLINKLGCETPAYSPDGRKIAFCHQGKTYILYREAL
jgi:hypothetical protein